ncbi:MAG TPA: SulP family inorganic anion transporter [Rhodocyclaceae bacterium]
MSARSRLINRVFPFMVWRHRVTRTTLRDDLIAALIGAVIVMPQGVAFATLAGLPPQYGLYAAMVPAIVGALFGSSWQLVSGPTNAISLVVFATLSPLAIPGSEKYVALAITLACMVGVMQLAMGIARMGAVVNFISHTVVVAFTSGAAILIMASQVRNFFGIPIEAGSSFLHTVAELATHLGSVNLWVLAVALTTILAGILSRRMFPRFPYLLSAMFAGALLGTALNAGFGIDETGIRTLGALPAALPPLSRPTFDLDTWGRLVGIAVAVTALGLTEAVSIARSIATKTGQRIDGDTEFIGQGMSNFIGSFFSAYPSSGSFNRSGANYEAGARTPLAAAFSGVFLGLAVFVIAPLAAYLPYAAMAGILVLVAWGLLDFHEIITIARTSRAEAAVLAVTFFGTLVMHLEMAIVAGVMLSLLLYLNRTARPTIRSLVPEPDTSLGRFVERKPGMAECPQLKILRIEGELYFGAVNHVAEYFHFLADHRPGQKHLLLMSRSMNFIDVAGAELLAAEARRRRDAGGSLSFHGLRVAAGDMLSQPAFKNEFTGRFTGKTEAIAGCFALFDRDICRSCTARIFRECNSVPYEPVAAADVLPPADADQNGKKIGSSSE